MPAVQRCLVQKRMIDKTLRPETSRVRTFP